VDRWGWESLFMDYNLDVVRGLACLFDPEGNARSERPD
jgi:hypothetical protein